jgi:hypothetical protein
VKDVPTVVAWHDLLQYLQEMREGVILDLEKAVGEREVGKAQGKLGLIQELMNLPHIFATYAEAEQNGKADIRRTTEAPPFVVRPAR